MTRRRKTRWPAWWQWELSISDHVERRMEERGFSEVDLRGMLANAASLHPSPAAGRFVVECRWQRRAWQVVVEPHQDGPRLIVVTAWQEEAR